MRIRPPEFETSICDAMYHVSLHWPPPPSSPKVAAAAAATSSHRKIISGQFNEENPFVLISSVLLVQADNGVSFLVVDRIGDFYRNLPIRADVIGVEMTTLLATRAWLRPVSRGNRHFTVDGGRLRQSGPRPDARLLRQPALEGLTRSVRTDSPRQVGRNKFRRRRRRRAPAAA
ncbi:hypothetical protein F511_31131 [Dorcoceras hygrometricum]|uniref:Uncharacterized protein n=1 Tax=Dorcoceras hygrometricum TaxID=472368 RepID=A0A2Z7BZZ4_9LAMI|nr:hypothetical protein F511_31131 [Dorcoceras hygrometricum]